MALSVAESCSSQIDLEPFIDGAGAVDLHAELAEVLLIGGLGHLVDYLALVDVLLERKQDLRGVYGLDEVVGDLGPDGLLHDVLLLALGDHDHGCRGGDFLDAAQCLEPAQPGHVLVEQDEVEGGLGAAVEGIVAVRYGLHLVAFLLEEEDVGLQELNLVVHPEQFVCIVHIWGIIGALWNQNPKGKSSSSSSTGGASGSGSGSGCGASGSMISRFSGSSIWRSSGMSRGAKCSS